MRIPLYIIFKCLVKSYLFRILLQASFLTLDLEDLAEQLSKVGFAERLFIEPDLLPQEMVCVFIFCALYDMLLLFAFSMLVLDNVYLS